MLYLNAKVSIVPTLCDPVDHSLPGSSVHDLKTVIMVSSPITSWQTDAKAIETGTGFVFLGSKITADGDCHYEFKRHLLLGRKAMTNLDSILNSRDITLQQQSPYSQSYGFSDSHVWMDHRETCRVGPSRRLSNEELMLLKCGVGKDSWESLGYQGD